MSTLQRLLLGGSLATLLAACGGGGDAPADPLAKVPAEASQSSAGLAGYLGSLPPLAAEMREPVSVDGFDPPRPEDTEPEPVGG